MAYGTRAADVRHQKAAPDMFQGRLRAWRERQNLSQSETALRLQISKRTLQEWEQGRAEPHGLARVAIEHRDARVTAIC
jgi:DNA-binding transcriptional regulator YiaG